MQKKRELVTDFISSSEYLVKTLRCVLTCPRQVVRTCAKVTLSIVLQHRVDCAKTNTVVDVWPETPISTCETFLLFGQSQHLLYLLGWTRLMYWWPQKIIFGITGAGFQRLGIQTLHAGTA